MSDSILRIVLVGVGGVGKSALTISYVSNIWVPEYDPTIEDWHRKQVCIDERVSMVDILDTAGQEEYSTMQDQWFSQGQGYLMVYSIINRKSFTSCKELFEKIERCRDSPSFPLVLVGNKRDMEAERVISKDEGLNLAKEFNCPFFETSAKMSPEDVEAAFSQLIRLIRTDVMKGNSNINNNNNVNGDCGVKSTASSAGQSAVAPKKKKLCVLL